MPLTTLLTDFGTDSPYVAEMKGVLYTRLGEQARIVDISHSITPQNIRHGAVVWRETVPWFPDGTVHVGVVDPGVGTKRRLLAARFRNNDATGTLVCPDNGLASLILGDFELLEAVHPAEPRFWNENISRTFHGRDILAPLAAAIAAGEPLRHLGPPATKPIRLELPQPIHANGTVRGMVLYVDAFGNAITNLLSDDIPSGSLLSLIAAGGKLPLRVVGTYGEAEPSTLVLLVGSSHRVELAEVNASAARRTGLISGAMFEIVPEPEDVKRA